MAAYEDLTQAEQVAYWFYHYLIQVKAVCEHPDVLNPSTTAFCNAYRDIAQLYIEKLETYFAQILEAGEPAAPTTAPMDPQLALLFKALLDYAKATGM